MTPYVETVRSSRTRSTGTPKTRRATSGTSVRTPRSSRTARVTREGSFKAGVDGALPGILIPADPEPGMAYRQEYYAGEAEDNGAVLSVEELVEVPYGQFDAALLTRDTIALEPDVAALKFFAPGRRPRAHARRLGREWS